MERDIRESMAAAQRTSVEVSRRKALGIVTKLGLGGAAAAALGAGVGMRPALEALAQGGLPQKPYKVAFVNHVTTNVLTTFKDREVRVPGGPTIWFGVRTLRDFPMQRLADKGDVLP